LPARNPIRSLHAEGQGRILSPDVEGTALAEYNPGFAENPEWADSTSSPFFSFTFFFIVSWQQAVERTVTGLGYEPVDLERSGGGLLRVTIDRVPGRAYTTGESDAVTVDDCELVTRQLQYVLEVEQCDYARLEVSSPGLDRPLKREADYERFAGSAIDLTLKLPLQGRKKFRGVLSAREGGGWRLVMEPAAKGQPEQTLDFHFDEVRDARLVPVIDFKGRKAQDKASERTR
jgi:ribosome maturation factor RimP